MIETKEILSDAYQPQADLCRVLNHPIRLAILDILHDGEQCVCHIETILGLRQAYISQHLMILRDTGFAEDRREGWNVYYHVRDREVYRVTDAPGALLRQPRRQIAPMHAATNCPCPKCND